jgi:hypothetical protein
LAWSVAVDATWLPACTAVCWTFLASSLATSAVDDDEVEVVAVVAPDPVVVGGGSGASME